jgi:L-rhamnose isomerase/sugar isomerase
MTMAARFGIDDESIASANHKLQPMLREDFDHLAHVLRRTRIDIEALVARAAAFTVAIPSWGVGTGGTRFARFPGPGEPRDIHEKLDDCAVVFRLVRATPAVSVHIPWDRVESPAALRAFAAERGLHFDAMNSNTFQDQPDQALSYKFGSLSHPDGAVRRQAIAHNLECIDIGQALGSTALSVWIGDGGNFPGQMHLRGSLERYLESIREIYSALPATWRLFVEHKAFEPAFYSTVINDWGTSYYCARELGPQACCLVDLGHHGPNVNIEMVVARLLQLGKLGGFHFNDSKYGDDDLDAGSIKPFQLFLIFNELVDAELEGLEGFNPAYMLDQSHNVTDPIESLMVSAMEVVRAYVQAHLVDREALAAAQARCDPLGALALLKAAYHTDVTPILATARLGAGGAIDPIATYRASGYRQRKAEERPTRDRVGAGIV